MLFNGEKNTVTQPKSTGDITNVWPQSYKTNKKQGLTEVIVKDQSLIHSWFPLSLLQLDLNLAPFLITHTHLESLGYHCPS